MRHCTCLGHGARSTDGTEGQTELGWSFRVIGGSSCNIDYLFRTDGWVWSDLGREFIGFDIWVKINYITHQAADSHRSPVGSLATVQWSTPSRFLSSAWPSSRTALLSPARDSA